MQEHPLLAVFAQLVGDFLTPAPASAALEVLLRRVAQALLMGQTANKIRDTFQFERISHFNTQYLTANDRQLLGKFLAKAGDELANTRPIRVFMREMPVRAYYLRSSVPDWARSAALSDTIGPVINRDGRQFWLDIYPVINAAVEIRFTGQTKPVLILGPDTPLVVGGQTIEGLNIGEGTIWVQAKALVSGANENQYFSLKIVSAALVFSRGAVNNHGRLFVTPGVPLIVSIRLKTPKTPSANGSVQGADARAAKFKLPEQLDLRLSSGFKPVTAVAPSSAKIFGDTEKFEWTDEIPAINNLFNAVSIPLKFGTSGFNPTEVKSTVFKFAGKIKTTEAAWLLTTAQLEYPLQAEGCGALGIKVEKGLTATCSGFLDANQQTAANLRFQETWVTGSPERLLVVAPASTEYALQTLQLWQGAADRWNDIQLHYGQTFPFFYQSDANGSETVTTLTDCEGNIDRPTGADGLPFALRAKTSLYTRTYRALHDDVLMYDENVIRDNAPPTPVIGAAQIPLTFQSRAIALNNALLTVSPINAFVLSGKIPALSNTFEWAGLSFSCALVGYLPTLPDPYAANAGVFKWMHQDAEGKSGIYLLERISRFLVGSLHWKTGSLPETRFIFGDSTAADIATSLNPMQNRDNALRMEESTRSERLRKTTERMQLHSGARLQNNNWTGEYDLNIQVNDDRRLNNHHFFSLLDVSTAADQMGVNLGYIDERFFFEKTFEVVPDQNPLSADGMDVVATGKLVRLFTVPQISWEPLTNLSAPTSPANDPPAGLLTFKDDGPPTLIGNTGGDTVTIAPLSVARYLVKNYQDQPNQFKAWSFFTLPFGILGIARYNQSITVGNYPARPGAAIDLMEQKFDGDIQTGLQISTKGYLHPQGNRNFEGAVRQLYNVSDGSGNPTGKSILSAVVTEIFNNEFGPDNGQLIDRGVPVERYDFSGYGANLFSHWLNPDAKIAQTSQAKFDVWRGRTAHEVIQVRSILYPFGIRVVRTITMFRNSTGLVYRVDSGWRAESDGVYDFKTIVKDKSNIERLETNGYEFHPGVVRGVFNVRNIVESDDLAPFPRTWFKTTGYHIDENDGLAAPVGAGQSLAVKLIPVYYDADVQIDDIVQGGTDGRTVSKRMIGYLQVAPRGVPISPELFKELLEFQNGLGGQVDCTVSIGGSGQLMRVSRVVVRPCVDGRILFVVAAEGMPLLPKDGSWSVVKHDKTSGEVRPISDGVVPLIRGGIHPFNNLGNRLELANPAELFVPDRENRTAQFAFLQNTDTQKVLFRNPWFEQGKKLLQSSKPDMADAYRLLNSKGIFPKLDGTMPRLDLADFDLDIKAEGYKLLNKVDPGKLLEQVLPEGPVYFVNEKDIKIYVEYANKDIKGNKKGDGTANFDLDSTARKWVNKMNDVTMVVDLLDMKRLFLIRGKFDTEKGKSPSFIKPELEFGEALQPVYEILQILLALNGKDYVGALSKGLKIAMSNSPNNWEYKFQADKEIPVLRFPPPLADSPIAPLRVEAGLKIGCYFNVGMPLPPEGLPMPSAGGYVEFTGRLSVMCISVAAATVYAVGTCVLRISADTVRGPGLAMKIGFGVELNVGLPVIGNVSVYYGVGVEISIDTRVIVVGAFIVFRGRAEILGGLVTIQIQIEASGKIKRELAPPERTECIAQVTFSLDISIFLVINISFSKSFQENRQIA